MDIHSNKVEPSIATTEVDNEKTVSDTSPSSPTPVNESLRARQLQARLTPFRWLSRGEEWLDRQVGIETQGIDRIPDDQKKPPSLLNCFFLWCTLVCHVGTLPIGFLGPEFGLSLRQSIAAIVVGVLLGSSCVAYCATLGPKTGLRAVAVARYSFGFYGAQICSILNVIIAGGFGIVNLVVVGQILSAVSDYKMTVSVGTVIVTVVSYVVSVFGFGLIHTLEKYAWIVTFVLISVLLGQAAPYISDAPGPLTGLSYAGAWLSFMTINFAGAAGWASFAADYYCNYPASTKSWKVFGLTFWGLSLPLMFTTVIGACMGNVAITAEQALFAATFKSHGLGGLISQVYHPEAWSRFCLVILTFSVVGNNVVILYSSGLSLQLLGHYFHAVPRLIWSLLVAAVMAVLAIVGKDHLSTIIANFVSLLGYWEVSFTLILLIENEWFRKGHPDTGYNLQAWDTPRMLPTGVAAVVTLLAGYLGGGLTGMAQVWYVGPIAAKFGPYGGDVGVFLCGAITLICYPVLRFLERRYVGR